MMGDRGFTDHDHVRDWFFLLEKMGDPGGRASEGFMVLGCGNSGAGFFPVRAGKFSGKKFLKCFWKNNFGTEHILEFFSLKCQDHPRKHNSGML